MHMARNIQTLVLSQLFQRLACLKTYMYINNDINTQALQLNQSYPLFENRTQLFEGLNFVWQTHARKLPKRK